MILTASDAYGPSGISTRVNSTWSPVASAGPRICDAETTTTSPVSSHLISPRPSRSEKLRYHAAFPLRDADDLTRGGAANRGEQRRNEGKQILERAAQVVDENDPQTCLRWLLGSPTVWSAVTSASKPAASARLRSSLFVRPAQLLLMNGANVLADELPRQLARQLLIEEYTRTIGQGVMSCSEGGHCLFA